MGNATVRGSKVEPGQAIKSANRWYTVEKIDISRDGRIREARVRDSKGVSGRLLVYVHEDYPVKAARPPAAKKITHALAARLVDVIAALQECEDCPAGLGIALDDARAEISPWCDRD